MKAKAHPLFWEYYSQLPSSIQVKADKQFDLWLKDPRHPSLHFKKIHTNLWSARVDNNYRALARLYEDMFVWFWIGSHKDYERILSR